MSRQSSRVQETSAYLLQATAWSETSVIARLFAREHGIITVVAKGAKRPYSVLRPVLSAFEPLSVSWSGQGEVKTLTRAELAGLHGLSGKSMMSAWYMNELLIRLLPGEDAHPQLYDAYRQALQQLAVGERASGSLRRFEWTLLQETGYGVPGNKPDFDEPASEPELRRMLRERIDEHLEARPLMTRNVLLSLKQY
ncbi:DNA repair protein RecO [Advenella kashmirensis W13003]|uniref:DNA repair protein RecO n=1 Tax=Advenella kashmirensis W13003 TaxID=1424334 RepID=V8QQW2_9BURK|nr:DNA repair protein RecO [Advenella kashmirensis]ETF01695.1 DNA repair protein RecO [Advenella kashmirensis W13003]